MVGWILDGLRCVVAGGLFVWSLLAVLRAPNMTAFFLAVGATELGWKLAFAALVVAVLPAHGPLGVVGQILAASAAVLFASPELRGLSLRREAGIARVPAESRSVDEFSLLDGRVRCFWPTPDRPAIALCVVVHGGGWVGGSPADHADFHRELARRGVAVASVGYRFAPGTRWPGQAEDVLNGLEAVRNHRPCPDRVILLGRSAGGQIASALATSGDIPDLAGCACFYAPFDMVFAYEHSADDDFLKSRVLLRDYLGGPPGSVPEVFRAASAYHSLNGTAPPFLLLHGTRDELVWVEQSRRFAARLAENGLPHRFLELPWATHAFDHFPDGPGGTLAVDAVVRFARDPLAFVGGKENAEVADTAIGARASRP